MAILYRIGALAVSCLIVLGCGESSTGAGNATLDVFLTDSPGDVAHVWVEASSVYLQGTGGRTELLENPTGLVEITSLQGTSLSLVQDFSLSPGTYAQLRFVIDAGVLETVAGDVYSFGGAQHPDGFEATGDLQCPSCGSSGIKVILGGGGLELAEGETVLVLDFQVAQSFGMLAGASGQWVMSPVIHATEVVGGVSSSISGTVVADVAIPPCPAGTPRTVMDFVPAAAAVNLVDDEGAAVLRSGIVQEDGTFVIGFVEADDYAMSAVSPLGLDGASMSFEWTVEPAMVTVSQGESVGDVAFSITSATCIPAG